MPIIEHQAVAFRLAEMATRIEAARLLVLHAARVIDSGAPARGIAAMAKLTASETAMFVTHGAVQTLGGWGYSREYPGRAVDARRQTGGDRGGHLRHHAAHHLAESWHDTARLAPATARGRRRGASLAQAGVTDAFTEVR